MSTLLQLVGYFFKDPWWDGEQTQEQAKRHLLEVDAWIAETGGNKAALDIYDNSSGHNFMAKDALNIEKLNIGVGGKTWPLHHNKTWPLHERWCFSPVVHVL